MFRNFMLVTAALVTAVAAYTPAHVGAQQSIVSSNYNHNVGLTLVGKVRPGGSVMLNPQPQNAKAEERRERGTDMLRCLSTSSVPLARNQDRYQVSILM